MSKWVKKHKGTLIFILIGIAALSRFYLWTHINPIFQGPDEVQHMAMSAQFDKNGFGIYHNHSATTWRDFEDSFDYKSDFYGQYGIITKTERLPLFEKEGFWGHLEAERLHKPAFDRETGTDSYRHLTYAYPPVYYAVSSAVSKLYRALGDPNLITYQYTMRLSNIVFYVFFLIYIHLLAQLILPGKWGWAVFAMTFFHPMFSFMSSVVNNDVALLPLSIGLFYHSSKIFLYDRKNSPQLKSAKQESENANFFANLIGLVLIGMLLTFSKNQGFLLSIITFSYLAIYLFFRREIEGALTIILGLSVLIGIYLIMPELFGKTILSGNPSNSTFIDFFKELFTNNIWHLITNTVGQFAWFEVKFSPIIYVSFGLFALLVTVFTISTIYHQWLKSSLSNRGRLIAFLLAIYGTYWLGMIAWQYQNIQKVGFIIQGRYALSALPILFILFGYLSQSKIGSSKLRKRILESICAVLITLWAAVSFAGLWLITERFYIEPEMRSDFWMAISQLSKWVHRLFQYKPSYFKSEISLAIVLATFTLSQIAVLGFFWSVIFRLKEIHIPFQARRKIRLDLRERVSTASAQIHIESIVARGNLIKRGRALAIFPTFNEIDCLPLMISKLESNRRLFRHKKIDICFIDDGSTDGTRELLYKSLPDEHVTHEKNIGVSGVLCTASKLVQKLDYDFLVQCDADGQHPIERIPDLIDEAQQRNWDLTIGSRFCKPDSINSVKQANCNANDKEESTTKYRYFGGQLISLYIKFLFGEPIVSDPTSGFRVYSRRAIEYLMTVMPDEYPEPESIALLKKQGYSVGEIPVTMNPRIGGKSSLHGLANPARFMAKIFLALLALKLGGRPRGQITTLTNAEAKQ